MVLSDQQLSEVVTVLADHGLHVLRVLVDQGCDCRYDVRDAMAEMLDKLPLVSHGGWGALSADPTYAAVIFYERTRRRRCNKPYFLDGLPRSLPVFGAPVALEFPAASMNALTYDDVILERTNTIEKLETMGQGSVKRKSLAESLDKLPDLARNVPVPVRLFISRVRSMCQGIRRVKPASYFQQCGNAQCCRFFYRGERDRNPRNALPCCFPIVEPAHDQDYWRTLGDDSLPKYDDYRFCGWSCHAEWNDHFMRLLPDRDIAFNPEASKRVRGEAYSRVSGALDLALRRNDAATRIIDKRRRRFKRKPCALSRTDFARELGARVRMLNIDAGLLYAASVVARVPSSLRERTLPGSREEWRQNGHTNHRNALLRVKRIYNDLSERAPIGHTLMAPSFFRELKSVATTVF